jgi:hypothetical protein
MNRLAVFLLLCAFSLTAVLATAENVDDIERAIQADIEALRRDSEALKRDMEQLNMHRAAKANAKANKEYGKQAGASLAIGADHTAITAKKAEVAIDEKLLDHHRKKLNKELDKEIDAALQASAPASIAASQ